MLTSGWKHTVRPDLLCREGTDRQQMKKGTTLFRGSALDAAKVSLLISPTPAPPRGIADRRPGRQNRTEPD